MMESRRVFEEKTGVLERLTGFSPRWILLGSLGAAAATGIALGISTLYENPAEREAGIVAAATADGFTVIAYDEGGEGIPKKKENVTVSFGSCAIDIQIGEYSRNAEDKIDNVQTYTMEGFSLPTIKTGTRGAGQYKVEYEYVDGIPVTFRFDSQADLLENILGDKPCETLARTYESAVPTTSIPG